MIQVHILGLHLEQVEANGADRTNKLNPNGVLGTVGGIDSQLESVQTEHHCAQNADGWEQKGGVIVILRDQVVVGDAP